MRLDETRIAVRERGILELLDLSAQTLRVYFKPLLITMTIGVVPLALFNYLLVGWMSSDLAYDDGEYAFRYYWNMTLLIILEAPLASIFATAYLGQAVFSDRPKVRQVVRETLQLLPRVMVSQLLTRGILIGWVFYLLVQRHGTVNTAVEVLLVPALVIYAMVLRSVRPFINEIIVLERNPMRAKTSATITVGRRSASLHGPAGGDLFVRSMASCTFACLLSLASFSMFLFISGVFANSWLQERFMVEVCWPLALWIVAMFMTVLRFLSYLDLRIRQEGWEVELLLRAEAAKLTHRVA